MLDLSHLGQFEVILADPPWSYPDTAMYSPEYIAKTPEAHYDCMTADDIKEMVIPAAKDSILFMWAVEPRVELAYEVIKAWGFTKAATFIWNKYNRMGLGFNNRINHEYLFMCKRGKAKSPAPDRRYGSVITAKAGLHSRKPDIVYSMIESMYPEASKIELFARRRREGWQTWGNQVDTQTQTIFKQVLA